MKNKLPTPETDAANLCLDCDDSCVQIYTYTLDGSCYEGDVCRADEMARLEYERNEAREQIQMMLKHDADNLESDSIVSSCNCLTKTNEVKAHKPGCKYRLISERDEALNVVHDICTALRKKDKSLPTAAEVQDRIASLTEQLDAMREAVKAAHAALPFNEWEALAKLQPFLKP